MNRTIIKLFFYLCILTALPSYAQNAVHYYFKTMDIRNGLSQNTVYQILQDRKGFMWFGTKDGLNRYDGLSYRVYKKENSGLGKNFITASFQRPPLNGSDHGYLQSLNSYAVPDSPMRTDPGPSAAPVSSRSPLRPP